MAKATFEKKREFNGRLLYSYESIVIMEENIVSSQASTGAIAESLDSYLQVEDRGPISYIMGFGNLKPAPSDTPSPTRPYLTFPEQFTNWKPGI